MVFPEKIACDFDKLPALNPGELFVGSILVKYLREIWKTRSLVPTLAEYTSSIWRIRIFYLTNTNRNMHLEF